MKSGHYLSRDGLELRLSHVTTWRTRNGAIVSARLVTNNPKTGHGSSHEINAAAWAEMADKLGLVEVAK